MIQRVKVGDLGLEGADGDVTGRNQCGAVHARSQHGWGV